jgi:hypothetical protein
MCKYLRVVFCFFVILTINKAYSEQNTNQVAQLVNQISTNNISATNATQASIIQISKYIVPENHAKIINKIFQENPIYTLRLQSSYKKALDIIVNANIIQETDVPKLKNDALKPVVAVFPVLHKKAFRFVNEPLFMSLLSPESKAKIMLITGNTNIKLEDVFKFEEYTKIPVGLKFLNCEEKDAPMFFDNFVKDKETLLETCKELIALFEPINNIFTDETKNKAFEFYKKLTGQTKTK